VGGIIVVVALIAGGYIFGLPLLSGSHGPVPGSQQPSAVMTQVPTTVLNTPPPVTPNAPVTTAVPGAGLTYEEKYTETYNQVYSLNHAFAGGQREVFTQDLTNPPLYIKFNITPKMYYGEKRVDIGLSSERIVNASYPSPTSWFTVTVYDAGNGGIVEEQGFNKGYGVTSNQEFMVRAPGNYRVEMQGNDVTADVRILTGK
jgi:hypothetical protein